MRAERAAAFTVVATKLADGEQAYLVGEKGNF